MGYARVLIYYNIFTTMGSGVVEYFPIMMEMENLWSACRVEHHVCKNQRNFPC